MGALLWMLVVGAVAGWLAGVMMKGRGFGLIGNTFVGVIGAVVGGFLSRAFGFSIGSGIAGAIVTALLGAIVLLGLVGLIKKS